MAKHRLLRMLDLRPLAVVADDRDHRQIVARHRLELHAVQAEAAVAEEDRHLLIWMRQLGGDGEACAGAQRAHRAGVEPVARLPGVEDPRAVADDIAAVADHIRVVVEHVAQLAAEAHRMNRRGIGGHQGLFGLARLFLVLAHVSNQDGDLASLPSAASDLSERRADIAGDADVGAPIDADVLGLRIQPDDLGVVRESAAAGHS